MSVGRLGGRPLSFCGRPHQPVHVGARQATGPVDRSLLLLLILILLLILVVVDFLDFLSLPTILHLGEDFSNLSQTEKIGSVDSKVATPVWLPMYPAQGIKPSVIHPKELQQAHAT